MACADFCRTAVYIYTTFLAFSLAVFICRTFFIHAIDNLDYGFFCEADRRRTLSKTTAGVRVFHRDLDWCVFKWRARRGGRDGMPCIGCNQSHTLQEKKEGRGCPRAVPDALLPGTPGVGSEGGACSRKDRGALQRDGVRYTSTLRDAVMRDETEGVTSPARVS